MIKRQCGHMFELGYVGAYGMERVNCTLLPDHDGCHKGFGMNEWNAGDEQDIPGEPLEWEVSDQTTESSE